MGENARLKLNFKHFDSFVPGRHTTCWYLLRYNVTPTIKTFQKDIIRKFSPEDSGCSWKSVDLFLEKSLLPSWESTRLLQPNDNVEISNAKKENKFGHLNIEKKIVCDGKVAPTPEPVHGPCESDRESLGKKLKKKRKKSKENAESHVQLLVDQPSISYEKCADISRDTAVVNEPQSDDDKRCTRKRRRTRKRTRPSKTKRLDEVLEDERKAEVPGAAVSGVSGRNLAPVPSSYFVTPTEGNRNHQTFDSGSDVESKKSTDSHPAKKVKISYQTENNVSNGVDNHISNGFSNGVSSNHVIAHVNTGLLSESSEKVAVDPVAGTERASKDDQDAIPCQQHNTLSINQHPQHLDNFASSKKADPMDNFISSKIQFNPGKGRGSASKLNDVQVFSRRKQKKKCNFPLSEAMDISGQDVYSNKSFVFGNGPSNGTAGEDEFTDTMDTPVEAITEPVEDKEVEPEEPDRDYSKYAMLYGAPRVGESIAYKVLEMSEDYTPGISQYKEAKVVSCDPASGILKLELTYCKKKRKPGRFDCTVEDEDEILTNDREFIGMQVEMSLQALVEPKLMV